MAYLTGINWHDVDSYYIKLFGSGVNNATSLENEFRLLDRNRDDLISKKEAAQMPAVFKAFNRADTNHDACLDQGEFAHFEEAGDVSPSSQTRPAEKPQGPGNRRFSQRLPASLKTTQAENDPG